MSRRVPADQEDAFRAWNRRIRDAAGTFPGYLGSEAQAPNPTHPGEWVTVYSFATAAELDAWLRSPQRAALIAEAEGLVEGPAREQTVAALRTTPEPVTIVVSQRIAPKNHAAFVAVHEDLERRLSHFDGFLGSDLFSPVEGVQDDHVIVSAFASRPALDAWLESDERSAWLAEVESLVEGERTLNVVGGFGGWFPAAPSLPRGPRRWKQAATVLLALFPTALTLTLIRREIAPDMNVILAVFVGNVLGVLVLSYVLMPWLTRRLDGWLRR